MKEITLKEPDEISAYFRGQIIQEVIEVELRIDVCIGRFFSTEEIDKVIDVIKMFDVSQGMLHTKQLYLSYILNSYYPQILEQFPNFFTQLEEVISIRNRVAHKRYDINNRDFSKLQWHGFNRSKKVNAKEYIIEEKEVKRVLNICSELYVALIYLDVEITNKWKNKGEKN